jgi:hypothetical protein
MTYLHPISLPQLPLTLYYSKKVPRNTILCVCVCICQFGFSFSLNRKPSHTLPPRLLRLPNINNSSRRALQICYTHRHVEMSNAAAGTNTRTSSSTVLLNSLLNTVRNKRTLNNTALLLSCRSAL